jgi:hypothetical protein
MIKNYIGIFIAIFLVSAIGFSAYEQANKTKVSAKLKRINCQEKTTTFEKIVSKKLIIKSQELLKSKNYKIESKIWKSKYATSKLFNYISKKDIDNLTIKTISNKLNKIEPNNKKLLIKFYTRENDKEDPGKHGTECKLYAGYLVYEFILDDKLVYKIQTDFMDFSGKDIQDRIDCVFNSFFSIK